MTSVDIKTVLRSPVTPAAAKAALDIGNVSAETLKCAPENTAALRRLGVDEVSNLARISRNQDDLAALAKDRRKTVRDALLLNPHATGQAMETLYKTAMKDRELGIAGIAFRAMDTDRALKLLEQAHAQERSKESEDLHNSEYFHLSRTPSFERVIQGDAEYAIRAEHELGLYRLGSKKFYYRWGNHFYAPMKVKLEVFLDLAGKVSPDTLAGYFHYFLAEYASFEIPDEVIRGIAPHIGAMPPAPRRGDINRAWTKHQAGIWLADSTPETRSWVFGTRHCLPETREAYLGDAMRACIELPEFHARSSVWPADLALRVLDLAESGDTTAVELLNSGINPFTKSKSCLRYLTPEQVATYLGLLDGTQVDAESVKDVLHEWSGAGGVKTAEGAMLVEKAFSATFGSPLGIMRSGGDLPPEEMGELVRLFVEDPDAPECDSVPGNYANAYVACKFGDDAGKWKLFYNLLRDSSAETFSDLNDVAELTMKLTE